MGAFDNYQSPQGSGAFSNYQPPAAQPSQSWTDYLLGHLAGANQTLSDTSRVASDAATFGLMDKLFGPQAQADTAAAYQRLGKASIPASIAGGLVTGGPELKAASAIGEAAAPYVGKWAGGVLGAGAAGASSSALGAYGHEGGWTPDTGDIEKAAAIGGGLGAGAGALGGVTGSGSGRTLPPASTSADLRAQASAAYKPLDNILYDVNGAVKPELDAAESAIANSTDLTGAKRAEATATMNEVNDLRARAQLSASDIQAAQQRLGKIGRGSNLQDQQFAPQFHDALQNVLEQGVPQTGVPQGAGPGYAAGVKAAGDLLHGRAEDMGRLENWQQRAAVTGGPDVASQARSFLTSPEGQQFAPPPAPGAPPSSAPAYSALNELAGTASKPETIPWYVKHFMIAPAVGTIANEGYAALSGSEHSPTEHLAADLGIGAALMGASAGYSGLTGQLNRLAQKRAIDAAGSTLSTGNYAAPLEANARVRNALQMLLLGRARAAPISARATQAR